jgi:alanine dehydrogenase
MSQQLRILSEEQVKFLYEPSLGWDSVEGAYREFGRTPEVQSRPSVMTIGVPTSRGAQQLAQFRVKGASVPSFGTAGAFLYAKERSNIYLWSTETSDPLGLVACDWLSKRRVALTVAVAIRALARPVVEKIALFGAGPWARQTCELLADRCPSAEIAVVASRLESAAAFAESMPDNVVAVADSRLALQGANVVVTLTNASQPFIHGGLLEAGALLLSMGYPHEVDVAVLRECDALIVDDLLYARFQGDIGAWLQRGDIDEAELTQRLRANIGEVLSGFKPGRLSEDERLIAVIQGLTACDIALAKAILDRAAAEGVGDTVDV